jgi:hypothetical protein
VQVGARQTGDPFVVLIASGIKSQVPNPKSQTPQPGFRGPRSR